MIGAKNDRLVENDTDLNLFSGRGSFAAGELMGLLVNPVHHGIGHGEFGI